MTEHTRLAWARDNAVTVIDAAFPWALAAGSAGAFLSGNLIAAAVLGLWSWLALRL